MVNYKTKPKTGKQRQKLENSTNGEKDKDKKWVKIGSKIIIQIQK